MQNTSEQRTYHETSSPYPLPNDATEHERLDLQNEALNKLMHNKPIHAPLTNPTRILDIGCGTGFVLKHIATTYPSAHTILGIDLSPSLTPPIPPQIHLLKGDFHTLTAQNHPSLQPGTFDYIFSRLLASGMTSWPRYIRTCHTLLAHGAYLEIQELDLSFFSSDLTPIPLSWHADYISAFRSRGADLHAGRKVKDLMEEAGFVDIKVESYRVVFTPWEGHPESDMMASYAPKYLPEGTADAFEKMAEGLFSAERIGEVKEAIVRDYRESGVEGLHFPIYVVVGRKP